MRRIILILISFHSFVFAFSPSEYTHSNTSYLPSNAIITHSVGGNWNNPVFWSGINNYYQNQSLGRYIKLNDTTNRFEEVSNCTTGGISQQYQIACAVWVTHYYSFCPVGQIAVNGACTNPVPTCSSTQELSNGVCIEKCDILNGSYQDNSGGCFDCSGFTDLTSRASCICTRSGSGAFTPPSITTVFSSSGVDYETGQSLCGNITIPVYAKIDKDYKPTDPCLTADGAFTSQPAGYTYKGIVSNDTQCASYVDGVHFLPPHITKRVDSDCPNNSDLYCYLLPVNATIVTPSEGNYTLSNTQIPNTPINPDMNLSGTSNLANLQLGTIGTDIKALNEQMKKQNTTFDQVLAQIKVNGTENVKSNQILGDINTGITQFQNKFGQWVDDTKNDSSNEISAINNVKDAVNTKGQGTIDKLDEILLAIKDSNGTGTEIDLNATNAKLDILHDDNNKTHSLFDKLLGLFDSNESIPDINTTGDTFNLAELLPDASFFETNKLNLNLNNYSGACYLESVNLQFAGKTFQFPPPELANFIPFRIISNLFMTLLFIVGLRDFLRN